MNLPPNHHAQVLGSPWPGIHVTEIVSGRHYGRHWHTTHGVGLLAQGAQRSASGRGVVDALAGDVITTNPGEVHDGRPLGAPSRHWCMLYFDPGRLAALAGESGDIELCQPVIHDLCLRATLQRVFRRLARWRTGAAEAGACEEALARCCELLLGRHATLAAPPRDIGADMRRVRERLADESANSPTLAALAAEAGCSPWQLLRRFESACGLTPHAWLVQRRVEQARQRIADGIALAQVAADCGFADQSHLTRQFVRHLGYTPGAWRRVVVQ